MFMRGSLVPRLPGNEANEQDDLAIGVCRGALVE